MAWCSDEARLGPVWGLIVALLFPLGYAGWDLATRRDLSPLSVLGFISLLLSGGFGLLRVGGFWFAIKEAALPVVLGLAIPLSLRTPQPLVRVLLYNDQVLDTERVRVALVERGKLTDFARLLAWASWMLALAMWVSAVTNFGLAWWLLPARAGTPEFNRQLGKLQFWSWPGTMLPTTAMVFYILFRLVHGLEGLTGLKGSQLFHPRHGRRAEPAPLPIPPEKPADT